MKEWMKHPPTHLVAREVHEVAAPEPLDLARRRKEAGVADGAVALHALPEARVRWRLG